GWTKYFTFCIILSGFLRPRCSFIVALFLRRQLSGGDLLYKCRIGWIWSLILTVLVVFVPRYLELKTESIPFPHLPAPGLPKMEIVEGTIQKPTLVATLVDFEVPSAIAHEVADMIQPVFDLRKIRLGNLFRLEKELDGTLRFFEYKIDDER